MSTNTISNDVSQLRTILVIGAHPDDETFVAGGLIAIARANGQRVVCVTATKGEAGVQNEQEWPKEQLAAIREKELEKALELLGVKEHYYLGYSDGECKDIDSNEATEKLQQIIANTQPDTVITFNNDGLTGHPDHVCVYEWTKQALKDMKDVRLLCAVQSAQALERGIQQLDEVLDIFYNLDQPTAYAEDQCQLYVELSEEIARKKCTALKSMPSQTKKMFDQFDEQKLHRAFSIEAFIEG